MKNLMLLLITFIFLSFQEKQTLLPDETKHSEITSNDKKFILDYFKDTATNLEQHISGLNEDQMHYKPSEGSWSVSQCLEHIISTEKILFGMTRELLDQPENPERKTEITATDEDLITGITDRSTKYKAPENLQPSGMYDSPEKALEDFKEHRKEVIEYINNSSHNLRNHITDSPAGPVDAVQSMLFIAGHTSRHTNQIEEIKSDTGFPQ